MPQLKDKSDLISLPYSSHLCEFVQMQKYFLDLKKTMPSMSPIDNNWPARPNLFLDGVHAELRRIFHLWRVSLK